MATATPTRYLNDLILEHLDGRPMTKFVEKSGIQKDRFRRIVAGEMRMYADEALWFAKELGIKPQLVVDMIPTK